MHLSKEAINKLKQILLEKNIFLDDLELQEFGVYVLTIGCEILKFKDNRVRMVDAKQDTIIEDVDLSLDELENDYI